MTNLKIAKLAHYAAREIWCKEFERLQRNPENNVTKAREASAYQDVTELERIIKELEAIEKG